MSVHRQSFALRLRFFVIYCCILLYLDTNENMHMVVVATAADNTIVDEIRPDEYISDEHWNYSKHLNEKNFQSFIQENIHAGKTIFVRWTAGLFCGSCAKQAPAWDDAIRLFAKHPSIVFGDVNIKEIGITSLKGSPHHPGYDGWPTIRYFNNDTGIQGNHYIQQTKLRKWDELGPDHMFLIEFIEEKSNSPLCDVETLRNCDHKSKQYINDIKGKSKSELQTMLESVHMTEHEKRKSSPKKRDLWLIRQKHILMQLVSSHIFVQWD
jgi:Thioredoxin